MAGYRGAACFRCPGHWIIAVRCPRSVEDCAITLGVIAGHDPADAASANVPVGDYLAGLNKGVSGLRVGIPRAFFQGAPAATHDVLAGIERTANQLRAAGATVEDITLPDYALFAAAGRIIMMAEAYAIHAKDMRTRLQDYGADHGESLRARRGDHGGGLHQCAAGAARTDGRGERRVVAL